MTTTTPAQQAAAQYLEQLTWMIQDAKRDLAEAAQVMARRATEAVQDTDAMLADESCSLMWVDFAESDLRKAREAKARLNGLYEQQKLLRFILKQG